MANDNVQVMINLAVEPNTDVTLHNGERVLLSDEELSVEGVVTYNAQAHLWLTRPGWATRREREVRAAPTPVLGS